MFTGVGQYVVKNNRTIPIVVFGFKWVFDVLPPAENGIPISFVPTSLPALLFIASLHDLSLESKDVNSKETSVNSC
jgi:hypothetical protein